MISCSIIEYYIHIYIYNIIIHIIVYIVSILYIVSIGNCEYCCMDVYVFLCYAELESCQFISRSATAVSYDNVTCVYIHTYFLRTLYTNLHNGSANLHSHKHCLRVPYHQPCILNRICCFLETSHLFWDEMGSQCSFVLHFHMAKMDEHCSYTY